MSIILEVAPEVEQRVEREAAEHGQDAATFLRVFVEERFGAPSDAGGPSAGKPDFFSAESIAAWQAMIDSFDEGDPEEQRASLEQLKRDLDEDRPGQRSLFGTGINPPRAVEAAESQTT